MSINSRYASSIAYLRKAEMLIPGGTQTFSKSALLYPRGNAPHFLSRGHGGRVWDIDAR